MQIGQKKGSKPDTSIIYARFVKRSGSLVDDVMAECLEHGKWNIIGATYNYKTGEASLFKNGELVKTINIGKSYLATQYPIRIGAITGGVFPFEGRISCLQIYNFTLNLEQVKQSQYVCRKSKNHKNLLSHSLYFISFSF